MATFLIVVAALVYLGIKNKWFYSVNIVELNDKYAVRVRKLFFKEYVDLEDPSDTWTTKGLVQKYCFGSRERAEEIFESFSWKEKVVK